MEFSRQECWSGLHFLLQRIFPTQGSNPGLLHCRQILYIKSQGQDSNPLLSFCKGQCSQSVPLLSLSTLTPPSHTHTHTHTLSAILTWLSMIFPPGSSPAEELSCLPAEDHCWSMRYGVYRTSPSDASGSFTPYFNSQWDPHPPCPQLHFLPCRLMERKSPGRGRWKATAPSFEGKGSL